jgi:hypothetical protein
MVVATLPVVFGGGEVGFIMPKSESSGFDREVQYKEVLFLHIILSFP